MGTTQGKNKHKQRKGTIDVRGGSGRDADKSSRMSLSHLMSRQIVHPWLRLIANFATLNSGGIHVLGALQPIYSLHLALK